MQLEGAYTGGGVTLDNIQGSDDLEGIGFNGVGATAFAGYDVDIDGLFVGAEANVDLNSAEAFGLEAK